MKAIRLWTYTAAAVYCVYDVIEFSYIIMSDSSSSSLPSNHINVHDDYYNYNINNNNNNNSDNNNNKNNNNNSNNNIVMLKRKHCLQKTEITSNTILLLLLLLKTLQASPVSFAGCM